MSDDIFDQFTADKPPQQEQPASDVEPNIEATPDTDLTPQSIKQCLQELLKYGLLEMERKPRLYQTALSERAALQRLLEPFDLSVKLDEIRGLAYLRVAQSTAAQDGEWSHPLVRRQRLTLEQSLLVAILRKHFLAHEKEAGIGAGGASVYVDDLLPELQTFLSALGSDMQEQKRLRELLEKLKGHGIVSEINDQDQVTIRPIIAHLANPENLQALLDQYRSLVNEAAKADT